MTTVRCWKQTKPHVYQAERRTRRTVSSAGVHCVRYFRIGSVLFSISGEFLYHLRASGYFNAIVDRDDAS